MTHSPTSSYGAFSHLLVVELDGSAAGAYCAKVFADFGAEVVTTAAGPRRPYYDTSKHRTADDLDNLTARADVVIQSSGIDPIAAPVAPATPTQIVVRVSPFAATGPYSTWRSTDLVDAAVAGHLRLSGAPDREPLQGVPDIVHHAAGMFAFVGAVAALVARVRTGFGQLVETSHQEVIAALHQFSLLRYTHNGAILSRQGNRYAGPGTPIGGYECADGWIGLAISQGDQMERMLEVTGLSSMLERDDVDSIWDLMINTDLLDAELIPYLKSQPRAELVELFQALRLPCAPASDMADLLADEHLSARGFWRSAPDDGLQHPGPPIRMSGHGWGLGPKEKQGDLPEAAEPAESLADGPLTGVRVLDMTRVWAGPLATRILADLGAEVLMTEVPWTRTGLEVPQIYIDGTHFFPDDEGGERPWNRSGFHNKYANNKLSTVIELDKEAGRNLFAALVPTADILVENYSPRVMPDLGFDQHTLNELNPDLLYVTMPGYGREGPYADWVAYGPTIDGHVGHTSLTGYRGEGPWKCGVAWPDPIGGIHGAAAALVGLLDRLVDPNAEGQTIEVAQIESAINMIGQHVVGAQGDDGEVTVPRRWGNRRPRRAPQGVYRCAGHDRWIAISVVDDQSWQGLCDSAGWGDLAGLDPDGRWERHDEIDERLTEFTRNQIDVELMSLLQAAGVPAGAAHDAGEVMNDPQLAAIGFFAELEHADAGTHPWPRFPVRLSATPATMRSAAALMGEHNEYAACDLAGYTPEQYQTLLENGIVRTTPPA
ncbi:MAG: CoA transferase [Actinomycetia bacterium]|nr:CoA transferase [Actinomycetes bacterium]